MKWLISLILIMPVMGYAQKESKTMVDSLGKGISFESGLSWVQVKAKAKAENKYIFMDCYTTWCGPCRQMEKEVYPVEKVGEYFNARFISVKVQMDTSKMDNETVKNRYADAHDIQLNYKIIAYPTFLFFNPDGQILNRSAGAIPADDFLALAKDVTDPEKDYYAISAKFQNGKATITETSWLARQALLLKDTAKSREIAKEYLLHLNKAGLLTKPNIEFMKEFTKNSTDKGFPLFYKYADSIDVIMGDDTYAQQLVQTIISKEIALPVVQTADKSGYVPDWGRVESLIQKKYNSYYADRVITAYRSSWGFHHKNWPEYTKYLVLFVDKFGSKKNTGPFEAFHLNNYAWYIFQCSPDKAELSRALYWSSRAVLMNPNPNWMDTYANILYKLGQKDEALLWEGLAVKLNADNKDFRENLGKMKNDQPTWPQSKHL